ncbi:hypothetical protein BJ138DRAFT_181215 [Hygrophoropsis aurantiaca]|uniref:Uncharacterized protein n=1 Tax=Hygrophoropsis aurantiaca TaxID=72124 RepID=A0ACB8AAV5_9AGAM|nr:hypothetical protein BJ138DRAFT_181215 [Hygrophoropsis aurantiaca]
MIVTPDMDASKGKEAADGPSYHESPAPPAYYPQSQSGGQAILPQAPFKSKPTNFLELTKDNGHLRGEYVIDPSLIIAPSYLPPLTPGETDGDRKNLHLYTKNGHVRADIWLIGANAPLAMGRNRATLNLGSHNGPIVAKLQQYNAAVPFLLNIHAKNGHTTVFVPRSFNGLLLLSPEHGKIAFSDGIKANSRLLGQYDGKGKYFVGLIPGEGANTWCGDEVRIESANGHIRIRYIDEEDDGIKSVIGKLIGL